VSSSRGRTYRQRLEPDTLKEEMERIWREDMIAYPCHVAKWIVAPPEKIGLWVWAVINRLVLIPLRGRLLGPRKYYYRNRSSR